MAVIGVPDYPVTLPAPRAPRFGLVQSVGVTAAGDEHWLGNVEARRWYANCLGVWTPLAGGSGPEILLDRPGATNPLGTVADKSVPCRELTTIKAVPFTVEGAYACGRGYIESEALFQQRAETAFAAYEGVTVEEAFWKGPPDPIASPHLDDSNTLTLLNSGTAVKPALGLALLEQAIADSDAPGGVIHMRPGLASMYGSTMVSVGATTMTTVMGTPIIAGSGYPGTGEDAAAITDHKEWAVVTGPVVVLRGAVQVLPSLDRDTNEWVVRVERDYLVIFDTELHAAVQIDKAA